MWTVTGYGLNLIDLACTLHALANGGVELNPLMRSVPVMVVYKTVVVGALLGWLGTRAERMAKTGLRLCTAVYGALAAYHLYFIL